MLPIIIHRQCTKTAMGLMIFYYLRNIDISNSISVCEHKRFFTNIFFYSFYSSSGLSIYPCIYNSNLPWFGLFIMKDYFALIPCIIKCNIASMKKIISKPFFDHLLLISCTYDKVIKSIK